MVSKKRINYLCGGEIEKSVPRDHGLSSLKTAILWMDFSLPLSHSWWIFIILNIFRAASIHWNLIISRYLFWWYAYRIVRSFHDMIMIQHLLLLFQKWILKCMLLFKRIVTIFPFIFSALISKPFSMLNSWYTQFWNSVEQDQLTSENPADVNIHGFLLCL